jgi:hypothetical protein
MLNDSLTKKHSYLDLAHKPGTTLLNNYFNSYDFANFGVAKEYHIWDAKYLKEAELWRIRFRQVFCKRENAFWLNCPSKELLFRYLMLTVDDFYEYYFSSLSRGGSWLTGNNTPVYAGLPSDQIRPAKKRLEDFGSKPSF